MRPTPLLVLASLLAAGLVLSPASAGPINTATCLNTVGRDVVVVFDRSASMLDGGKLPAAKTASNLLLSTLSATLDQSALVTFSTGFALTKGLNFNHPATQTAVNAVTADGATNLGGAIRLARFEFDNGLPSPAPSAPYSGNARAGVHRVMVVLSDGDQTIYSADPVWESWYARSVRDIEIYAVALGTSITPAGLSVMENVSSSKAHFYASPTTSALAGIFQNISYKLNDSQAPTVSWTRPVAPRLYEMDADVAPSPLPASAIVGPFTLGAAATDDCQVASVDFSIDGGPVLVNDTSAPYQATIDCDALAPGLHTARARSWDWLNKSATTTTSFYCVRPYADAQATALYARATNPADPLVRTAGARSSAPAASAQTFDVLHAAGGTPLPYDLSFLHDETNSSTPSAREAFARSLSRQLNVTLPTIGQRFDILESTAWADVDARAPLGARSGGSSRISNQAVVHELMDAAACISDTTTTLVRIERCGQTIVLDEGVTLILDERITRSGIGWSETTVNGLHLLLDRPEMRGEIILSQSYAGSSWLGASMLRGPERTLDAENDAGSGADAPPGPLSTNALSLAAGTYGARVRNATDVDAYAWSLVPGEKLHVDVAASDQLRATVGTLSPIPNSLAAALAYPGSLPGRVSASAALPQLAIRLLDPTGHLRDQEYLVAGGAAFVELNVDMPGDWVVQVQSYGMVGDYTMQASVTSVPMTHDDDALLGVDAGESCAQSLLVGPGAHVGSLEHADPSDWYRFQLEEGQLVTLALRPGDTVEAADMRLAFYDRACNLVATGAPLLGTLVKGSPELVTWNVPPGASGLYRAEVAYVNGIGTYELAIATSVAATP